MAVSSSSDAPFISVNGVLYALSQLAEVGHSGCPKE